MHILGRCKNIQILSKFIYELETEHLWCLLCSKYKHSPWHHLFYLQSVLLVFPTSSSIEAGKTTGETNPKYKACASKVCKSPRLCRFSAGKSGP